MADGTVRPILVVVSEPSFHLFRRVGKRQEPVSVQALAAEPAVEGLDEGVVRGFARLSTGPECWLEEQWAAGRRNGAALWRQLRTQGFRGSLRVVTEWATRRRRAEKADSGLTRTPSSRTIARLMTVARDRLSRAETVTVTTIETAVPQLVEAREIVVAFQAMIRRKSLADLEPWLERARMSLVASFANGVTKDQAAVAAAITSGWSNGQTEGQITKLKLVKRQMYGRGKIDLLQARVIGPA